MLVSKDDGLSQDPQKVLEDRIEKHNHELLTLPFEQREALSGSRSTRSLLSERLSQARVGQSF